MATRHYFASAVAPPPRVPKPKHKGLKVVLQMPDGSTRITSAGKWAHLQGSIKGAKQLHALGLAHRWTSAEASAAASKGWKHKGRFIKRIGRRVGRSSKQGLRAQTVPLSEGVVVKVVQTAGMNRATQRPTQKETT